MFLWAVGFPAAEVLLQSWGVISLVTVRQVLAIGVLLTIWIYCDGWRQVYHAPWWKAIMVGGLGFGGGGLLLMFGQKYSDAVTPAIAAAMMPIAGAILEVMLDGRKLRLPLVVGIALAIAGGILATGVKLGDGEFGFGALLCLGAIVLFAWATRATTHDFSHLSTIGRTTITLTGGLVVMLIIFLGCYFLQYDVAAIGNHDLYNLFLILFFSLVSLAFAHLLWIWAAGNLGILVASLHMNAVPFYVMVTMVIALAGSWNTMQAIGATLVAAGVVLSQLFARRQLSVFSGIKNNRKTSRNTRT